MPISKEKEQAIRDVSRDHKARIRQMERDSVHYLSVTLGLKLETVEKIWEDEQVSA